MTGKYITGINLMFIATVAFLIAYDGYILPSLLTLTDTVSDTLFETVSKAVHG